MLIEIDFEWARDEVGYRLVPPWSPQQASESIGDERLTVAQYLHGLPARVVPASGRFLKCRPFENAGVQLHRIFVGLGRTKEGLLQFTNRYGPLTAEGNKELGEAVDVGLRVARQMDELLIGSSGDRAAYTALLGRAEFQISTLNISLAFDPLTGKAHLKYSPPDLRAALLLELAHSLTSEATLRTCKHCGEPFFAGPGTGRREDALFCSAAHQRRFNSLKRSNRRTANA